MNGRIVVYLAAAAVCMYSRQTQGATAASTTTIPFYIVPYGHGGQNLQNFCGIWKVLFSCGWWSTRLPYGPITAQEKPTHPPSVANHWSTWGDQIGSCMVRLQWWPSAHRNMQVAYRRWLSRWCCSLSAQDLVNPFSSGFFGCGAYDRSQGQPHEQDLELEQLAGLPGSPT